MSGKIYLVGIGPGSPDNMTIKAVRVLKSVPTVICHRDCLELIQEIITGKEIIAEKLTPVERSEIAVERALAGGDVAIVTTGDPGIYAIASTFFSYLMSREIKLPVEIVPGVTIANAAAALLGSPLGNDFAAISLADLANQWNDTKRRLELAAEAGFVIVLYNPRGKLKNDQRLREAVAILINHRGTSTPVGVVTNATVEAENVQITTLGETLGCYISSQKTILIIGNSGTVVFDGKMITPREYKKGVGY